VDNPCGKKVIHKLRQDIHRIFTGYSQDIHRGNILKIKDLHELSTNFFSSLLLLIYIYISYNIKNMKKST